MGFAEVLGLFSGNEADAQHEKLLFNSVIGFRGIVDGVGTSTILASLAIALSERTNKRICVVDTNILYPTQFALLCGGISSDARATMKDWFSVTASIPERIVDTKYKRVSLLGCFNRRISDAFSTTDTTKLADETFDRLKDLFDIILVDLSHEWSQLAMSSATHCNKIFTVMDLSARCMSNVQQSLNNLAISAVPFSKFRNAIINKYSVRGFTGLSDIISQCKLEVVATIPFSQEIYVEGTLSRTPWGMATASYEVAEFNEAIDTLLYSIASETPLEIIDLQEKEEIEQAIANSTIKNKAKARKIILRERGALLTPASEEEKAETKRKRKEKFELRKKGILNPDADAEAVEEIDDSADTDFGFNTASNGNLDGNTSEIDPFAEFVDKKGGNGV